MRDHQEDGPPPRPRPKESLRTTRWSPVLLDVIRTVILGMDDDFVVKETVAHVLKAQAHDVGQALAALVREGFLSGPVQHPTTYVECGKDARKKDAGRSFPERVRVGRVDVEWDGRAWTYQAFSDGHNRTGYRKPGYGDSRTTPSKREVEKLSRKNPRCAVADWDGVAYRIERRSRAYLELQAARGVKPKGGKTCRRCGREFPRQRGRRRSCPDKDSCNVSIIRGVMET